MIQIARIIDKIWKVLSKPLKSCAGYVVNTVGVSEFEKLPTGKSTKLTLYLLWQKSRFEQQQVILEQGYFAVPGSPASCSVI